MPLNRIVEAESLPVTIEEARTWARIDPDVPDSEVEALILTAARAYRVRADPWQDDNLVNGDRYFYISRVLLVWLLVLEWHAAPRAVAWLARVVLRRWHDSEVVRD